MLGVFLDGPRPIDCRRIPVIRLCARAVLEGDAGSRAYLFYLIETRRFGDQADVDKKCRDMLPVDGKWREIEVDVILDVGCQDLDAAGTQAKTGQAAGWIPQYVLGSPIRAAQECNVVSPVTFDQAAPA